MGISEYSAMIRCEVADLMRSLDEYDEMKRLLKRKPMYGDGAEWKTDSYGVPHCTREGLSQGSTITAIERKIITLREHLNELRKLVC